MNVPSTDASRNGRPGRPAQRESYLLVSIDRPEELPPWLRAALAREADDLIDALDWLQGELAHHHGEPEAELTEHEFATHAERDTSLDRVPGYAERRGQQYPGVFSLPDGGAIVVQNLHVTVVAARAHDAAREQAIRAGVGAGATVPMAGGHTATISEISREAAIELGYGEQIGSWEES